MNFGGGQVDITSGKFVFNASEAYLIEDGKIAAPVKGALYTPSDGRAEPQKAVPAMTSALRRAGGIVVQGCAVRGVETKGGRVSGVVTVFMRRGGEQRTFDARVTVLERTR